MDENEEKFNTVEELYKRLLPAINAKLDEFKREKIYSITNIDIWNYCVSKKWRNKKDLRIYEMVEDILNIDFLSIKEYISKRTIDNEGYSSNI